MPPKIQRTQLCTFLVVGPIVSLSTTLPIFFFHFWQGILKIKQFFVRRQEKSGLRKERYFFKKKKCLCLLDRNVIGNTDIEPILVGKKNNNEFSMEFSNEDSKEFSKGVKKSEKVRKKKKK